MNVAQKSNEASKSEGAVPLEHSRLSLRLGYQLVDLAMSDDEATLLGHVRSLRAALAREWGVLMAPVHIQDDLGLPPRGYAIRIEGRVVAEGTVVPGSVLAITDSGTEPPGDEPLVADPVFGLPARWVTPARGAELEHAGCMVMATHVVISTHLSEIMRAHLPMCFGLTELEEMLTRTADARPGEVAALEDAGFSAPHVLHVARAALRAGRSIAPIGALLDAMLDSALTTDDFATVTVRAVDALAPSATTPADG